MSSSDKTIIFISHEAKLLGAPKALLSIIRYVHNTKKYNILVTFPEDGVFKSLVEDEKIPVLSPTCLRQYYRHISEPGSRLYKIFIRIIDNFKLFLYFCALFRKYKNSVVYANTAVVRYIAFPALITRKKLIWHVQEYSNNPWKQRLHSFLIGNFSDKIIMNSPFLISKMRLARRNNHKVHYFHSISIVKKMEHEEIKSFTPFHDLLFAGKISIEKGALDLLQAMNNIIAMNKNIDVAFAGLFVEEDLIKDYIAKYNLNKLITFYGFVLDIEKCILDSKAIVNPSYRDNLPTIILEGLMLEKPVICTDVGDIRSVVTHGKNGIIFPPGDVEKLTEAIITVLDPDRYHHFVKGAVERKTELLSGGNDFEKLDNIIQVLLEN